MTAKSLSGPATALLPPQAGPRIQREEKEKDGEAGEGENPSASSLAPPPHHNHGHHKKPTTSNDDKEAMVQSRRSTAVAETGFVGEVEEEREDAGAQEGSGDGDVPTGSRRSKGREQGDRGRSVAAGKGNNGVEELQSSTRAVAGAAPTENEKRTKRDDEGPGVASPGGASASGRDDAEGRRRTRSKLDGVIQRSPEDRMESTGARSFKSSMNQRGDSMNVLESHRLSLEKEILGCRYGKSSVNDALEKEKVKEGHAKKVDIAGLTLENVAQLRKQQGGYHGNRNANHERLVRWLDDAGPPYEWQPSGAVSGPKSTSSSIGKHVHGKRNESRVIRALKRFFCCVSDSRSYAAHAQS